MNDLRIEAVEAYCAELFPEKINTHVENWRAVQGGWESEIFAFDLCSGSIAERDCLPLAVRLYSGNSAVEKAAHEFRSMRHLFAAGYPVPKVYAVVGSGSPMGRPFLLMDFIDGQVLRTLMEVAKVGESQSWLELFCSLFVRLHRLDWRIFVDKSAGFFENEYIFIDRWLENARMSLLGGGFEDFTPVVEWLSQHRDRMACARPAALHMDFHPANILIRIDGTPAVIDWTAFTVSDPRFDLAWTLILSDAYMGGEFRQAVLYEYERQSGAPVSEIEAFEVCACARRLFDISVSLGQGAEQRGMRPEAEAAMKRDMPATLRVYNRLVRHSGVRIPRFEKIHI